MTTLEDALTDDDTWVIGGAQIYALALPLATRCEVTEVDIDLPREDDDAVAPVLDEAWVGTEGDWLTSRPVCATGSSATCGRDDADGRRRRAGSPSPRRASPSRSRAGRSPVRTCAG